MGTLLYVTPTGTNFLDRIWYGTKKFKNVHPFGSVTTCFLRMYSNSYKCVPKVYLQSCLTQHGLKQEKARNKCIAHRSKEGSITLVHCSNRSVTEQKDAE